MRRISARATQSSRESAAALLRGDLVTIATCFRSCSFPAKNQVGPEVLPPTHGREREAIQERQRACTQEGTRSETSLLKFLCPAGPRKSKL